MGKHLNILVKFYKNPSGAAALLTALLLPGCHRVLGDEPKASSGESVEASARAAAEAVEAASAAAASRQQVPSVLVSSLLPAAPAKLPRYRITNLGDDFFVDYDLALNNRGQVVGSVLVYA